MNHLWCNNVKVTFICIYFPFTYSILSYQINERSQGSLKNRLLLVIALKASLQWEISERIISNLIMVTLSKECPLVLQISRGCLLFSVRGNFLARQQGFDLLCTKGVKRACNGQTDPGVLWPSKGKMPHVLKVLDKCSKWTLGTQSAAPSPELLLTLLLFFVAVVVMSQSTPPLVSPFSPFLTLSWSISV